jgi:hypothetical protein
MVISFTCLLCTEVCCMFRPIYRSSSGMFHKNTKFLELGCLNIDPYYTVRNCYYLANIRLDNIKNVFAKSCCCY